MMAGIGMVALSPLIAVIAAAIKLDSPGPVMYRATRSGRDGAPFTMYKFRTMQERRAAHGPKITTHADRRVTRVGRLLRPSRLDELPQLWNVLRGDMSFVGPRPERPFFVEQLSAQIPFYEQRHAVKPGLTGWAQIKYQYGSSVEDAMEKLRYDLYYIKHLSIAFDLSIVFDTVKVIMFGKGAK